MKPLHQCFIQWLLFSMATFAAAGLLPACSSDSGGPAGPGEGDSGLSDSSAIAETGMQDGAPDVVDSAQGDATPSAEDGGLDATTDAASDASAPVDSSAETSADAGVCSNQVAACVDGMRDCQETDTDCGGPVCVKCQDFKSCAQDSDCLSHNCALHVCEPAPEDAATEGG